MQKCTLLILFGLYLSNGLFMNECFPKIRRVSENTQHTSKHKDKSNGLKIYVIDIDGTICETKNSDYYNSIPKKENIKLFNKLYEEGHEVHYWTARGANSGKNWDDYTVEQLIKWGVKYTSINLGKPHYDVWIDDKSINMENLWNPSWLRW